MAEGRKFDEGKLRVDLIPVSAIRAIARGLTFGARKYGDRNWENGLEWSRVYGAAVRHLLAFWDREDIDPESGYLHIDHAITNLAFLVEYVKTHPEMDDRPTTPT